MYVRKGTGKTRDAVSEFFFNDAASARIYTLPLRDALPIFSTGSRRARRARRSPRSWSGSGSPSPVATRRWRTCRAGRSEEHTSELQSRQYLVCRLLLEKKNPINFTLLLAFPPLPLSTQPEL